MLPAVIDPTTIPIGWGIRNPGPIFAVGEISHEFQIEFSLVASLANAVAIRPFPCNLEAILNRRITENLLMPKVAAT